MNNLMANSDLSQRCMVDGNAYVVEGVFSDEHGSYPQGSWIRSPHVSQHQPFCVEGCLILVKTRHLLG
jgi:anti-sigma factor ChrR (cupin superfamily)